MNYEYEFPRALAVLLKKPEHLSSVNDVYKKYKFNALKTLEYDQSLPRNNQVFSRKRKVQPTFIGRPPEIF